MFLTETDSWRIQSDNHFNLIIFECDEKFYVSCKLITERDSKLREWEAFVPGEAWSEN